MKIEMNEDAKIAVCTTVVCATFMLMVFLLYRYNVVAFEKGYSQKQMENSQMTIWVKE
jgi:hypothetical protein